MNTSTIDKNLNNVDLESKRNAVVGTLKQAKGLAQETLGKVTNDSQLELRGKKDKIAGTLQKNVGDSWAFRNKNFLVGLTSILTIIGAMVYYMSRNMDTNTYNRPDSHHDGYYAN